MAWNNNSGGPWGGGGGNNSGGGGGGGPWGGGGGGNRGGGGGPFGSRRPPDMEDVIRKGQERLRNLMPGGLGSFKGLLLIALAAVVIWLVTGFFRVQPNQQAIQLVFGKPYGGPVASGLHYNLPAPIGNVVVVNVQDQRRTVIGSRGATDRTPYGRGQRATSSENLMLTGDENIVDIEFAVLWQIKDVFKYAFDVRNGEENVRAGRRGRHARGDRQVQPAICADRGPHAHRAGHQGPAAAHPRRVRAGRADRPGPAAAGRPAAGGDRRLPRRAGRARRQGEEHQRGQHLPQPGAAARQGRGGNHHPAGRGLQGAEGRQRQGRHPALRSGLRPVRQGQGHHLGAPLHRGDRRGAAQREQGADRQERRRVSCPTCRCPSCAPVRHLSLPTRPAAPPAAGATR